MRVVTDLAGIGEARWDTLLGADAASRAIGVNPFLRYAFLSALHEAGCAIDETGWGVEYLTLWDGDSLEGAVPLYRKSHSYGEYVFDWSWADAYRRHGQDYYPKLLSAIPFTR